MSGSVIELTRRALPLMQPAQRAEAEALIASLESEETLAQCTARAAAAFENDMQPVCTALAGALHANDLTALKGFQALLPGLLREVNRAPALADLLAHQLGTAFLAGLQEGSATQPSTLNPPRDHLFQ